MVVHFTAKAEEAETKITVVLVKKSGRGLGLSVVLSSFGDGWNDMRMFGRRWDAGTDRESSSPLLFLVESLNRTASCCRSTFFAIFLGKYLSHFSW